MRKRKLDFSPLVSACLTMGKVVNATKRLPVQSLEYWEVIQGKPLSEALQAVCEACEAHPDVEPQSIYEPAGFWHVGVFAKYYFEEELDVEFGGQHEIFFSLFKRGERDKHLNILAPRSSGKSTCVGRIYPLHCIFYHSTYQELGLPTDDFILIISYSFMQAKDHIIAIRDKIENDERFEHLMGTQEWGSTMLRTANGVRVVPLSVGKSLRGVLKGRFRPTLVIKDDVDATDTVRNPDMREKARLWHDTNLLPAGQAGFTNFISIDTLKNPESLASILRTRPNVKTTHLRAITHPVDLYHPEHEDLWEEWAKIYADMSIDDEVREARANAFYVEHKAQMTEGVKELWPERLSYLQIRKYIIERGYPFVCQEFQNDISAADEFIFDMTKAARFRETQNGLLRDDNVLVKWNQMAGATVFLDWSGTRADSRDNCFACVVAVIWVPQAGKTDLRVSHLAKCHGYVYSAWIERGTGATQYTALLDEYDRVRDLLLMKITSHVPTIHCVQEGFVDTTGFVKPGAMHLFDTVLQKRKFKDVTLQFLSRAGAEEKHTRIRLLQAPFDNKWIVFNEVLPAEFERQLSLFPTADYDDGPDALEGALIEKFKVGRIVPRSPYLPGGAEDRAVRRAAEQRRRISL